MPRVAKRHRYCVYLIECKGRKLYCGYTHDIKQRYEAHATGKGAKFTRANPPIRLAHLEYYPTRKKAMAQERKVKRKMSRQYKLKLIRETKRLVRVVAWMFAGLPRRKME